MNETVIQKEFAEEQRRAQISYSGLASVLSMILMPLGSVMDWFVVDRQQFWLFLQLRLASSVLVGIAWLWFVMTGRRHNKIFGVMWYLFPTIFILWMIYEAKDANSPYYAGLNLVQLALGVLSPWTYRQNLASATLVIGMYLWVCFFKETRPSPVAIFNNVFFLVSTGSIVVASSRSFYQLRFREFVLRFELDRNKQVLEKQKQDLEAALKQLKETEAELIQNEKLASIGRLGAGIMHEINNPLNYATTGLFTLRKQARFIAPDQQAAYNETLTDVEEGVKRVSAIVSDLRSFAHHDNESIDEVPATEIITSAMRFMSHEWNEFDVKLEPNIPADQKLAVNKNKLIQVCVNLLQNSLDALKEKHFTNGEQPTISIIGKVENGLSMLIFRDNGPGIKPENVEKIFDPFFTTKDVGEGMGMGLSICYRIVAEYQGRIRVNTEPGQYCEFALEFPVKG